MLRLVTDAGGAKLLEVHVARAAHEVDAGGWRRLARDGDLRLDREWFSMNEGDFAGCLSYVVAYGRAGAQSILPWFVTDEPPGRFLSHCAPEVILRPQELTGAPRSSALEAAAERLGADDLYPSAAILSPYSLLAPTASLLGQSEEHIEEALRVVQRRATEDRVRVWAVIGVPAASLVLHIGEALGYHRALVSAETALDLAEWHTFDEYLTGLSRTARRSTTREMRRARDRGLRFDVEDGSALADQLAELMVRHYEGHGRSLRKAEELQYLQQLFATYGEELTVVTARRSGRLVAFSSLLRRGSWFKAFDYAADPRLVEKADVLYPNFLYAWTKLTIENGGGTLYAGPKNWEAKLRRGCRLAPVFALYQAAPDVDRELAHYLDRLNAHQHEYLTGVATRDLQATVAHV